MSSFDSDDQQGAPRRTGLVSRGPVLTRRDGLKGLVGAASLATLAACGGGSTEGSGEGSSSGAGNPDAIINANNTEPQNPLVPTSTNEVGGGKVLDLIFAGLAYYTADGETENDVAESIESQDAQNYTIKIKSGQTYSDGTPVTAKDFVAAWNYGALSTNDQLSSYFFEPIQGFDAVQATPPTAQELSGLKVVDDLTFTVALTQPESDFPQRLGYSAFFPLPPSAFTDIKAFGENPVGNGPYKFKAEGAWQHDQRIDLVKNETYKGARVAKNGGIGLAIYSDYDSAYADLQGGNLDVIDEIPASSLATVADELGDRAVNQPSALFQSFTVPARLAHFGGEEGKLRRQALSLVVNRAQICDKVFQKSRTPAKDFTSPVLDGYSADVQGNEVLDYDKAKALELWGQANAISPWSGSFNIAYNADGPHKEWVDAVTAGIRQDLEIDSEGAPYPTFAQLRTEITNRTIQTAFRSGWQADYPGLYNFLAPIYATGAGSNDGDYSNPQVDALLTQAAATTDVAQQQDLLRQVQTILFADLPAIPLWYQNATGGSAETVNDVKFGWNSVPIYEAITKA